MNTDVQNMICANTRTPEVTWGDVRAQINTNTYGISKFAELFGKHGVATVQRCWQRWMDICEAELRKEIAKVPDGRYGPETDYLDDDGVELSKPHRISAESRGQRRHLALHARQRRAGTRPDQPASLRVAQLHRVPGEDDLHPAFARERWIVAPGDGLLSVGRLAAQSAVPGPGEYVRPAEPGHDLGGDADLGTRGARPGAAPGSAAGGSISSAGRHPATGRWYSQYEIMNGGTGARPDGDGVSTMDELVINVMNTPVEAVETEFSVRIERCDLPIDSGGAGTFRGGLGTRRQWRCWPTRRPSISVPTASSLPRRDCSGQAAAAVQASLESESGEQRPLTSKVAGLRLRKGDLLTLEFAGGGVGAIRVSVIPSGFATTSSPAMCPSKRPKVITAWRSIPPISASMKHRPRACGATGRFMTLRIGIDVGGTFTDVVAFDERKSGLVAILDVRPTRAGRRW